MYSGKKEVAVFILFLFFQYLQILVNKNSVLNFPFSVSFFCVPYFSLKFWQTWHEDQLCPSCV